MRKLSQLWRLDQLWDFLDAFREWGSLRTLKLAVVGASSHALTPGKPSRRRGRQTLVLEPLEPRQVMSASPYLLHDTFTDANDTGVDVHTPDVGNGWTQAVGAMQIVDGHLTASAYDLWYPEHSNTYDAFLTNDVGVSTYRFSATLHVADASSPNWDAGALLLRYHNDLDFTFIQTIPAYWGTTAYLYHLHNDTLTQLGSGTLSPDEDGNVTISAYVTPDYLHVDFNGASAISCYDNANDTSTVVGLALTRPIDDVSTTWFDDVSVIATTALDDSAAVPVNSAVDISVLANDTDAPDSGLSIYGYSTPAHGSVSIDYYGNGLQYTPDTDYTGLDQFTYTVEDSSGTQSTATVYLNVGGQWAHGLVAAQTSSTWDSGPYDWYASQALGPPDATQYGDNPTSWSPDQMDGLYSQTLTVSFKTAVHANGFLIRETAGNGFVTKVEMYDGTSYQEVWAGSDSTAPGAIGDFVQSFSATSFITRKMRITVDLGDNEAWEEIDAVSLYSADSFDTSNAAPTVANESVSTDEDNPLPYIPDVEDADADQIYLVIDSQPQHGYVYIDNNSTANDNWDDKFVYVPERDYHGDDNFAYHVVDVFGAVSETATVTVTVNSVNDAPVTWDVQTQTPKNTSVVVSVIDSEADNDGDTLYVSTAGNAAHGSVSLEDGVITYTPPTNFIGMDTFSYTINDGNGGTATGTASVIVYESGAWGQTGIETSGDYSGYTIVSGGEIAAYLQNAYYFHVALEHATDHTYPIGNGETATVPAFPAAEEYLEILDNLKADYFPAGSVHYASNGIAYYSGSAEDYSALKTTLDNLWATYNGYMNEASAYTSAMRERIRRSENPTAEFLLGIGTAIGESPLGRFYVGTTERAGDFVGLCVHLLEMSPTELMDHIVVTALNSNTLPYDIATHPSEYLNSLQAGITSFLQNPYRMAGRLAFDAAVAILVGKAGEGLEGLSTAFDGGSSTLGEFANPAVWEPPAAGTLMDQIATDHFLELMDEFDGTVEWRLDEAPNLEGTTQRKYGGYNPVTNTITLYQGADWGTAFHELLHYEDVQAQMTKWGLTRQQLQQIWANDATRTWFIEKGEQAVARRMLDWGFTRVMP